MTTPPLADAEAFAVLHPDGQLTWHTVACAPEVERLVGSHHGPAAVKRRWLGPRCPLLMLASDVALLFLDQYQLNPTARRIVAGLSQGHVEQPFGGAVGLFQPDPDGCPTEMDPRWVDWINHVHSENP